MSQCTFCDIVKGEINAAFVYEDDTSVAFLDHRPLFPGHILLAPRSHYVTLPDLPTALVPEFFVTAQLLSRAVQLAMKSQGTFVAMNNTVSQSVPHLHVHIVPRTKGDGLKGFFWPRTTYKEVDHIIQVQESIRAEVRNLIKE